MARPRRAPQVRQDQVFKGRQFTAEVILWAVRWYLMFPVSYRDLELMLMDRGVKVDHTTIFRWIQAYAAELEKRIRPHPRMSNGSWRVDETYAKVKGRWIYLYRAVDSRGQTIDFLLSARRDTEAAKRFFRKAPAQPHTVNPRTITVDKNAACPKATAEMKKGGELWRRSRLRQVKYLNNIVEQDHRNVKRLTRPGLGFGNFWTARRTLAGYEAMAMMRKGQVRNISGRDIRAQATFIAGLFPRLLATRSGRLNQPPADDARGLDPRNCLLRPVQRAEYRLLDQLTAAVIAGRYGLGTHDPLRQVPRRQRLRGVAQFVIDPPKTLALTEPGTSRPLLFGTDLLRPDIGIEQPHRRVEMRQICPLPRQLLLELAHHPGQFRSLVA
jgi:IS6 family transposase